MKYLLLSILFMAPAISFPPSERCITDTECENICLTDAECAQLNREYEIGHAYRIR
jgi:hypothetical protein